MSAAAPTWDAYAWLHERSAAARDELEAVTGVRDNRGLVAGRSAAVRARWRAWSQDTENCDAAGACAKPLLARARAALAARAAPEYAQDSLNGAYEAHDGAPLRDELAAQVAARWAEAAAAGARPGRLPRWARARGGRRTELVALTPLPPAAEGPLAPSGGRSTESLLHDAVLIFAQPRNRGAAAAREAEAACAALLTARAEAELRRITDTSALSAQVATLVADSRLFERLPVRALGGVLSADGAALRLCAAVATSAGGGAPATTRLLWLRALRLRPRDAGAPDADRVLDAEDAKNARHDIPVRGARILVNLLALPPRMLGHRLRVPLLLARIVADDVAAAPPPDVAALAAALEAAERETKAAKAAEKAVRAELDAARARDAAESAESADGDEAERLRAKIAATRAVTEASNALVTAINAGTEALGAENAARYALTKAERAARMAAQAREEDGDALAMAAAVQRDRPAGAGNHSAVYAPLVWRGAADDVAAKVAFRDDARLAEEAELLAALQAGRACAAVPRLLHASSMPFGGKPDASRPEAHQPAFLVVEPAGAPLGALLARLPRGAGPPAAAARAALAAAVAEGLLDALKHAHARGVAHNNIKPHNVILAPPPPPTPPGADAAADAALLAAALAGGAWRPRAVLIDWGTALPLGCPAHIASQRGFGPECADAARHGRLPSVGILSLFFGRREWVLTPQVDLEAVAYVTAAAAGGGDSADDVAPWLGGDGQARWETPPDPRAVRCGTLAELEASWVGPVAAARAAWLEAHPEALGDAGRRFLQRVRAGHAVYTWGGADCDEGALPPAQPLVVTGDDAAWAWSHCDERDPTTRATEAARRAAEAAQDA